MGSSATKLLYNAEDSYQQNVNNQETNQDYVPSFSNEKCDYVNKYFLKGNETKEYLDSCMLKFHDVCGNNIKFQEDKTIAERNEKSFCDAIVFSNRPINLFEKVFIRITKTCSFWNGIIRFGFTNVDPELLKRKNSNRDDGVFELPKYVYPDLTNKHGYWAGSMLENCLRENDVFYFYVDSIGEIHYGVNDDYKGKFLDGVEIYNFEQKKLQKLWAIFDLYGNTIGIQIFNELNQFHSNKLNNFSIQSQSTNLKTCKNQIEPTGNHHKHNHLTVPSSNLLAVSGNSLSSSSSDSSSTLSSSSTSSSLRSNSSLITVIPNTNLINKQNQQTIPIQKESRSTISNSQNINNDINNNKTNSNNRFDLLLFSFRRLCVDNHLNETLHNSISYPNENQKQLKQIQQNHIISYSGTINDKNQINDLHNRIRQFYASIPILLHESSQLNNETTRTASSIRNQFLSKIHGENVRISTDCLIAYRESSIKLLHDHLHSRLSSSNRNEKPTTNAYVFLDRPIEKGKYFCIQIVGIDKNKNELEMSLGIGCTTCIPQHLDPKIDLPDDAYELLDRPEYWIIHKNLFHNVNNDNNNNNNNINNKSIQISLADELCFRLDESSGDLNFFINGNLITKCLFNVDVTQRLWFFFDLCGATNAIRLIPACSSVEIQNNANNLNVEIYTNHRTTTRKSRPNSALIEYLKSHFLDNQLVELELPNIENESTTSAGDSTKLKRKDSNKSSQSSKEECRICMDAPIECVFYSCGHMCLCWNCAVNLKNQTKLKKPSDQVATNPNQSPNESESNSSSNSNKDSNKKQALCPICRLEIIDIIRFFKT